MSLRQPIAVILCIVMAVALLWSKALLSITAVVLSVFAVVDIHIEPLKIRWLLTPRAVRDSIRSKPYLWVFALFFLLYFVSGLWAGDLSEWWSLTHPKVVFLIIPLAFAFLPPFSLKEYMLVVVCLIIMSFWSSVWTLVAYIEHYQLFNNMLGYGGSLPTPNGHIRFSVITAICMILCLAFAIENLQLKYRWERIVYAFLAIWFFAFLHILSVRTGLALGYAGLGLLTLFYLRHIAFWKKTTFLILVACIPVIAYYTIPTFTQKVNYSLYDLKQFKAGGGESYSDSERWQSWRAGLEVGNQHPFFGTGPGHFRESLRTHYKEVYQRDHYERPHNQFINVFTIFGILGLTVFLFTLIYPMTIPFFHDPPWIPVIYLMQILSMMVEHPLDIVVGTSMFLLLTMMGLSYQGGLFEKKKAKNDNTAINFS